MENGRYTYDIRMETPLGRRRGNLELMVEKHFLFGYLTMFTGTVPIRDGHIAKEHISFCGDLLNPMKTLFYRAEGTVRGSSLSFRITTELGTYPVSGKITQARRF